MNDSSSRFIWIVCALLIFSGIAMAQVIAQQKDDDKKRDYRVVDARDAEDLAQEYVDILEDLQNIIDDYSEYRDELSPEERAAHPISFDVFIKGLKSGRYDNGHEQLLDDIEEFISKLRTMEKEHAAAEGTSHPKCCRMIRNLRRELEILADLLGDYDSKIKISKQYLELSKLYKADLAKKLAEMKIEISDTDNSVMITLPQLDELEAEKMKEAMKALEELRKKGIIPPSTPTIEYTPYPDGKGGSYKVWTKEGDEGARKKEFTESTEYDQPGTVVNVLNSYGSMVVSGWDEPKVSARLVLKVRSRSSAKEQEFFEQSGVDIHKSGSKIGVVAQLPKLRDPDFQVTESNLLVMVPFDAPVDCENSNGQMTISDLNGGLTIKGSNSQASVSRIDGDVKITSISGNLVLVGVDGKITADIQHGSLIASDCEGAVSITGEHHTSNLTGCTGSADVVGIGSVKVVDHYGPLKISNSKGMVEVDNQDGDLTASNSFKPLIVRRISGTASLENKYADISADGISGRLTAALSDGKLVGSNLKGPLMLTADKSSIQLTLMNQLAGASTINADGSTLNLSLSDNTDIHFVADIDHSVLKAAAPITVNQDGTKMSAEGRFGRAINTLTVTGKGLTVTVNE